MRVRKTSAAGAARDVESRAVREGVLRVQKRFVFGMQAVTGSLMDFTNTKTMGGFEYGPL
jgi:hypothetical protein